ncbi:MAG: amidase [Bacteroidota bacterium]
MKVHSFSNDVLGTSDAVELADRIRKKEISAQEVFEASIERAEKVDPHIHAIAYKNFKPEQLFTPTQAGGFSGVPLFFKDMVEIKGIPTTYGSAAFTKTFPSEKNDQLVDQFLKMGFINLGMSTMPEFGFICSTEFPHLENTANPWNTDYSSGGSSGGAAALVAAGVIPLAHSADGGGSTRIPANCCGLVGLKATRGRIIPSKILEVQLHPIAIDGVVTRSVRDTAFFYQEAEQYYHNKKLPKIGRVQANKRTLTIAYAEEGLSNDIVDDKTRTAFEASISVLKNLGHELIPVKFPIDEQRIEDFKLLWASSGFSVKHLGKLMFSKYYNPNHLTKFTNGLSSYYFNRIWKTPRMLYRLRKSTKDFDQFLSSQNIDVILTPTMGHTTPPIGYLNMSMDHESGMSKMSKWACFTPLANANGCPSINLPMYHDAENDLPIGMSFWANYGNDKLLLELSYQIEAAAPWKKIYE